MEIGSFGEFTFAAHERGGACSFNSLQVSRASRVVTHTTIEGLPIVEFLGLDAESIKISGVLHREISGDLDDIIMQLKELQDGQPRVLTRGTRVYGQFVVKSFSYSEDAWQGSELAAASYSLDLVSTRAVQNG